MVFNYARKKLIYLHDINSYYLWFVLNTLGNTVVSLIDALPKLHKIKVPCQSTMKTSICCAHQMCTYMFLQNLLLTWIHYVLFVATLVYCWAWVYLPQEDIIYLGNFFVWIVGVSPTPTFINYPFSSCLDH